MKGNLLLFGMIFSAIEGYGSSDSEKKFTDSDLHVIETSKKYLNPQCVVFVDRKLDLNLMKSSKTSENKFFFNFLTPSRLEKILSSNLQLKFFQKRTLIVTKEKLNLTSLINKVFAPFYVSWLIFEDDTNFPKLYIPVSSLVIFIKSTSKMVSANQVYHLKEGVEKTVKNLWNWDLTNSANSRSPAELLRTNFQNISMNMLVLNTKETCKDMHGENLLKKIECVHQNFLELMGQRLNFSINVVECQEKEHPYTYPNGSDSELFLKLKHREVDFCAVNHVIRPRSNRNYIDFVWPTFVLKSRMYLKRGRFVGRWTTYLRPLESFVWWGILLWIVVTGILIQIFEKLLVNKIKFDWSFALDLITSVFNALQVFCNQAISDLPKFYSIRLIFFLKFFVVLIFFQAYCGYLVSSITVVVNRFPFKDLKGFFENEQYHIMTLKRGLHQFYFRKVIGEGKRENFMLPQDELPETTQQALDKLCNKDHLAFTEFREDLLNFNALKCKISELPSPIVLLHVGIAMPKHAPLKEFFRRELLLLKSTGLVQRLGSRLHTRSDFRDNESYNDFTSVSMAQIFSVFSLLGLGILLSIVILIIELIIQKSRKQAFEFCKKYLTLNYLQPLPK